MTKKRTIPLTHYVVILGSLFSLCPIALATTEKGYLVPTPASIPAGMTQIERPYSPYSESGYVLEYTSPNPGGQLVVSETAENAQDNFGRLAQNYEIMIGHSIRKGKGCISNACPLASGAEKIRDIDYMGAHGALYHTIENSNFPDTGGYDLLMNDNGKLLRILAANGPNFYFNEDMVVSILHGMVRQD